MSRICTSSRYAPIAHKAQDKSMKYISKLIHRIFHHLIVIWNIYVPGALDSKSSFRNTLLKVNLGDKRSVYILRVDGSLVT